MELPIATARSARLNTIVQVIFARFLRPALRPELLEKRIFDKRENVLNPRLKRTLLRRVNALLPPRPLGEGWGEGSAQPPKAQNRVMLPKRPFFA